MSKEILHYFTLTGRKTFARTQRQSFSTVVKSVEKVDGAGVKHMLTRAGESEAPQLVEMFAGRSGCGQFEEWSRF